MSIAGTASLLSTKLLPTVTLSESAQLIPAAESPEEDNNSADGKGPSTLLPIVVAVICVIAIVCGFLLFLFLHRSRSTPEDDQVEVEADTEPLPSADDMILLESIAEVEWHNQLSNDERLSATEFGVIDEGDAAVWADDHSG
jgi:hypothetical protein